MVQGRDLENYDPPFEFGNHEHDETVHTIGLAVLSIGFAVLLLFIGAAIYAIKFFSDEIQSLDQLDPTDIHGQVNASNATLEISTGVEFTTILNKTNLPGGEKSFTDNIQKLSIKKFHSTSVLSRISEEL